MKRLLAEQAEELEIVKLTTTYLMTSEGWLYLAVIIDLYSRQVVGWTMNSRMAANLVGDALKMALFRRGLPEEVIFTVFVAANTDQKVTAR